MEPRYRLIDIVAGEQIEITTTELQNLFLRIKMQQPRDGAYFEYATKRTEQRTEHRLPLVQRNNGC